MTDDKGCAECTDWGNGKCTEGCRPDREVKPVKVSA